MRRLALFVFLLPISVQAESIFTTNEFGDNAVNIYGAPYSWDDLLARRALNPERFDANHERLGYLLRNTEMLCDRYEENSDRFTFYHPFIGYLLESFCVDDIVIPEPPPSIVVPPIIPEPPMPPNPNVIPEPSSIVLVLISIICCARRIIV